MKNKTSLRGARSYSCALVEARSVQLIKISTAYENHARYIIAVTTLHDLWQTSRATKLSWCNKGFRSFQLSKRKLCVENFLSHNLVQKNISPDRTKITHYSPERTRRLDITWGTQFLFFIIFLWNHIKQSKVVMN